MIRLITNLTNRTMVLKRKHNHIKDQHTVVDTKSLQADITVQTITGRGLGTRVEIRDRNRGSILSTRAISENNVNLRISMAGMAEGGSLVVEVLPCQLSIVCSELWLLIQLQVYYFNDSQAT